MEGNQLNSPPTFRAIVLVSGAVVAAALSTVALHAETTWQRKPVGRFVALGVTDVAAAWKSAHPMDEKFIYLLDSATGRIEVCSGSGRTCRPISGSERDPKGGLLGRFTAVEITRATAAWKGEHPSDDHLIYSLDSTNAQIQVCGDMEGGCALVFEGQAHEPNSWPKIVMLYRRADTAAVAGRMYDWFVAHYGEDAVFLDVYKIPLATDWREQVEAMTVHGGALIALIGPRWLGKSPDGHVRIHDVDDPVRTELETALGANIPVFPVLVDGASMPKTSELPESLRKFPDINAATVDTGRDFGPHMVRLIRSIDQVFANRVTPVQSK